MAMPDVPRPRRADQEPAINPRDDWPTEPIAAGGIKKAGPETPPLAGHPRVLPFTPKAPYTHVVHLAKVIRQNSAVLPDSPFAP
jgi:hypothetical protein